MRKALGFDRANDGVVCAKMFEGDGGNEHQCRLCRATQISLDQSDPHVTSTHKSQITNQVQRRVVARVSKLKPGDGSQIAGDKLNAEASCELRLDGAWMHCGALLFVWCDAVILEIGHILTGTRQSYERAHS